MSGLQVQCSFMEWQKEKDFVSFPREQWKEEKNSRAEISHVIADVRQGQSMA